MSNDSLSAMDELVAEIRALRETMERERENRDRYDRPMTRERAAEYLRVHPDTLYRWAIDGLVAYSRLGDGQKAPLRFTREDLDDAISRNRIPSLEEARSRL